MNIVSELKQKVFKHNGKTVKLIGVKGGLIGKAILKIQGRYGAAIRKNVQNMKRDILAIWEHRKKKHNNCGAWCLQIWQRRSRQKCLRKVHQ